MKAPQGGDITGDNPEGLQQKRRLKGVGLTLHRREKEGLGSQVPRTKVYSPRQQSLKLPGHWD